MSAERDSIAKEPMEWKLNDDIKQRDYEKMLTNAKKKTAEEEVRVFLDYVASGQ